MQNVNFPYTFLMVQSYGNVQQEVTRVKKTQILILSYEFLIFPFDLTLPWDCTIIHFPSVHFKHTLPILDTHIVKK